MHLHWRERHAGRRPGGGGKPFKLDEVAHRPNAGATAICGKVEAELAEMDDEEAAEFLGSMAA